MNVPLRVLDLFSGIGGFSLGLERTGGFKTVAFCEIEPFPRRVLAKHWPEVPCYDDVRTLTAERLRADGICVDVICGGFPCQDLSVAGNGAGLDGARSGLWSEIARLAGELRPRLIIVENVAALLGRGLGRVLGDLAALGYDAEWHCIPASAAGASHHRDRFWLVANSGCGDARQQCNADQVHIGGQSAEGSTDPTCRSGCDGRAQNMADTDRAGCVEQWRPLATVAEQLAAQRRRGWSPEPSVGRVAHGVSNRVDRLRGLGNAVVPQIPELIGNAILASLAQREAA